MPITSVDHASTPDTDRRRAARTERYRLRRISWQLSPVRTLRGCGRATQGDAVGIHAIPDGEGVRGAVSGLVTCSSVWACAVCSAHIRQERSADIDDAADRWLNARGGGMGMLTLTLRHRQGQPLGVLLEVLMDSWRRTISGAPWVRARDKYGIRGLVRAVEVTHGNSGWHPHLHVLFFFDQPLDPAAMVRLEAFVYARFADMVTRKHGRTYRPSKKYGVKLQAIKHGEIGRYVAKVQDGLGGERGVGLELARGDLKNGRLPGSRLPFDFLAAAADDDDALALWREYCTATKGRRAIEWGRCPSSCACGGGSFRRCVLGSDERADEAITAEGLCDEDNLITLLVAREWHAVCRAGLDAVVLEVVERDGSAEAVHRVVQLALERTRRE